MLAACNARKSNHIPLWSIPDDIAHSALQMAAVLLLSYKFNINLNWFKIPCGQKIKDNKTARRF